MSLSTQHKLDRIRPPRVQITYDVEIGGAIEKKELPLVIGVLADLAGKPETPLPRLKERGFVEIDRDNFNDVLGSIHPRLAFSVPNKLSEKGGFINAELRFSKIDDFEPVNLVNQIPALKKLFDARNRLSDLLAKLDGNDDLDGMLQQIVSDTDALKKIKEAEGAPVNA
jgi:type VI secretion system protein ImpB